MRFHSVACGTANRMQSAMQSIMRQPHVRLPKGRILKQTSPPYLHRNLVCATQSFYAKFLDHREACSRWIWCSGALPSRGYPQLRVRTRASTLHSSPAWRNWQTRWTQNPMNIRLTSCRLSCICEHERHKAAISDAHNVNSASTATRGVPRSPEIRRAIPVKPEIRKAENKFLM
jgi:hypothetical protein